MVAITHIVGERNKKPIDLNGSVALVGNSDTLIGSGRGAEIDGYDTVIRFNLADLAEKYTTDVGSKADYCFFSLNISTHKYPHTKQEHMRFIKLCRDAKIICYPGNTKNVKKFNKRPAVMTATVDDVNAIIFSKLSLLDLKFSLRNHPRNGIKLLACLLKEGVKPALFGFDLKDRSGNSHYFDDELQLELPQGGHLPSVEYRLLKELEREKLISIM